MCIANCLPRVVFTTLKIYTLHLNLCAVLETVESTESEQLLCMLWMKGWEYSYLHQ